MTSVLQPFHLLTRTTSAAIIYPTFCLSDQLGSATDKAALFAFVNQLREEYRDYVRQAIELANS